MLERVSVAGGHHGRHVLPRPELYVCHGIGSYSLLVTLSLKGCDGLRDGALEALERGWDNVVKMRDQYHRRRDLVVRRFNEIGLKCHSPRGSFYAFPDITSTGLPEKESAVGLLAEHKVAVVPGLAFGENGRGHVRACFATGYEQLMEACGRIERFVQSRRG